MSRSAELTNVGRGLTVTRTPGLAALAYQITIAKLAWRNMWRNWRRTIIAMLAIVLGIILLLFADGLIAGSDQAIFGNAVRLYGGNIQVHATGFRDRATRLPLLPMDDADAVIQAARAQPEVLLATQRIVTGGIISSREGAFTVAITAVEPAIEELQSIQAENIVAGRYLHPDDGDAVVIGKGLADLLDVGVGERVTVVGRSRNEQMRQRSMTVVGIFDLGMADAEKGMAYITLPAAQTLYNLRDQATEVAILLRNMGDEAKVMTVLQQAFPHLEVDSWETLRPELRQIMDTKAGVSAFFSFIVLLIASIGVLNLMLMAVFERTREMGILAATGMKGRQIMGLFLWEGAFIGVVAAAIGCALATLLLLYLAQQGMDFSFASGMGGEAVALMGERIYPSFTAANTLNRGIAVALIAALASLYPAWQASRQEPAQALHHV